MSIPYITAHSSIDYSVMYAVVDYQMQIDNAVTSIGSGVGDGGLCSAGCIRDAIPRIAVTSSVILHYPLRVMERQV